LAAIIIVVPLRYCFLETLLAGQIACQTGIGHDEGHASVALAEKHAGGVPAHRAIVDIEAGQMNPGMARAKDERGHGLPGEPLLQLLADREQNTAEHVPLPHECLNPSDLEACAARSAHKDLRDKAMLRQVCRHLTDVLVGGQRHSGHRLVCDEADETVL
jgi:hypothetical protein